MYCVWIISIPGQEPTYSIYWGNRTSNCFVTMLLFRYILRLMRSTISPARRRRFIINMTLYKRRKPAFTVQSTCWDSLKEPVQKSFKHRPAKYTVTPKSIRSPNTTGGMSIRSVRAPVTTRVNVAQKRYFLITVDSTIFQSRLPAYLIPMARGCIPMMVAWCLISLCRPSKGNPSRFTVMVHRHVHFVTSMIS